MADLQLGEIGVILGSGIDLDIEVDVLAADGFERGTQRRDMFVLELLGDRDLGRRFAFLPRDE